MKFYAMTDLRLRSFTTLFQPPEQNRPSGKPEQREAQYGPSEPIEPILSAAQNVAATECACPQCYDIIFRAKRLEIANAARKSKQKVKKVLFRLVAQCTLGAMSFQQPGAPLKYAESRIVGAEVIRYEDGAHIQWYLKDGWQGNIGEFAAKLCEDIPGDVVRSWQANFRFLERSFINPGVGKTNLMGDHFFSWQDGRGF
jgi:hypothetical protein